MIGSEKFPSNTDLHHSTNGEVRLAIPAEEGALYYATRVDAKTSPLSGGQVQRIALDQKGLDRCVVLGRGYHYATAREWSLKLKELAYVLADPYSSADFIHGPLALIEAGFPTFCVAPSGATEADMEAVIERLGGELDAHLLTELKGVFDEHLDQVVTEGGPHGLADLSHRQGEGGLGELGHLRLRRLVGVIRHGRERGEGAGEHAGDPAHRHVLRPAPLREDVRARSRRGDVRRGGQEEAVPVT